MKKKLLGIFVCMLLIATALPSISSTEVKFTKYDNVQDLEFVPGEFIVKLVNDIETSRPLINQLNEKYQVSSIEKVFRNAEDTILDNIYILSVSENSDVLSIVKDYASCSCVVYAEPNYIIHPFIIPEGSSQSVPLHRSELSFSTIPNDENFSKQWALHNTGQTGGTPDADIDAPEAWDIETGDSDVVIAIVDSGVDYTHEDLADNIWINEDEIPGNGIDDDGNGFIDDVMGWDFFYDDADPLDGHGHGTVCSGVAAAVTNNGIGIAGVCWDCKIMPVAVANESWLAYWSDIGMGIKYSADNGADVISMSFGGYYNSSLLKDAVDYAYGKGVVLVAACGNHDTENKHYPAAYDNVIAVAGTDHNDTRMSFYCEICGEYHRSNYGDWVDVAAPGQEIYTTMPTYHVYLNDFGLKQNYETLSGGTSFACPHVAGLAGLILSKNPSYSQDKVRSIIRENVDPYDSEEYIGTGRINAYKALMELYTQLDIEITGGLGVGATIINNGLGNAIGVPYEITVTGGLLGLINKTVNGTIDIAAGATESISSGLLLGFGGIEITVTVGVKEETAEGFQIIIFTLVKK